MSDETQQTQTSTTSAGSAGRAATATATTPTSGTGRNIPAAYLQLSYAPAQRGTEPLPGVTLKRAQVLSWRDHGTEIVVVTTEPITAKTWRDQKLVAAKATK